MNRVLTVADVPKPEVPEEVSIKVVPWNMGTEVAVKLVNASGQEIRDGYLVRFRLDKDGRVYIERFGGQNPAYVSVVYADNENKILVM